MNLYFKNFWGLYLPLLGLIAGCTSEGSPQTEEKVEDLPIIETVAVTSNTAAYTLKLPGEVTPYEQVIIYPKVTGFVQQIQVDRGSQVKKGQLLARLDAPEITQDYIAASARLRETLEHLQYSQQAYNRLKEASKSEGSVASIELEQAQARLMGDSATFQSLKAEMAAAEQLADYLEIRAPFDGIITERNVSQGALVGTKDEPLFSLAQQDKLRLTIAIPEKHARGLGDSTEIRYQLSHYPNEIFTALISRSSGVLNKSLRSLVVEFDISNEDKRLSGGEYIQSEVPFQRSESSLWVPSSSIVNVPSGIFVQKVENDTIRRVEVREGIRKDGFTEVFGELQEDDLVVVKGSEELRNGTPVKLN